MLPLLLLGLQNDLPRATTYDEALELFEVSARALQVATTNSHGWCVIAGQVTGLANCLVQHAKRERLRGPILATAASGLEQVIADLKSGGTQAVAHYLDELEQASQRLSELR